MKKAIRKVLKDVIKCLPRKYIICESVPDLSDNTKAVFDEMIRRGVHKKYKFVWLVKDSKKVQLNYPNTVYVDYIHDSVRFLYYKLRAKCIICCNSFVEKANARTISFYLTHATQIKDSSSYYRAPKDIDFCFVTSKAFEELMANVYGIEVEKMVSFGFPRNDVLFKDEINVKSIWKNRFNKVIVWYPTFRQSKGGRVVEGCECLPIIHNEQQAVQVNSYLYERNVLIVLKPHFVQDISYLKDLKLSNIQFIDDEFFGENGITSYEFVRGCDALLTDYSSIYFDYLACDRPIGAIWEDIEFYKKNRGFCMDIDYYLKGAEKIYTVNDFLDFIDRVSNGIDIQQAERKEIRALAHEYSDGKNTDRVVDYIMEQAML